MSQPSTIKICSFTQSKVYYFTSIFSRSDNLYQTGDTLKGIIEEDFYKDVMGKEPTNDGESFRD